mmetsp:Transcript_23459/g.58709  ORF Transcript_23459/g.58709 Transcript_23459/m.58709 type:complete len:545 (+) Transcript_23459:130-1764(+)|eukprot:CAMPEP_0177688784 /NCGR_PEP_ID=MMETSP0447-20121125/34832_1 /TAXON_ID=0 /ORGANISM="Stygamoeba regulata, Strain BSH-02190019" /LENGTH=544 /DNA_ID=CAMNT_0019199087 /DNA_START=55 /DNA_END=1689 /DNA_ORIENTATION=-
MQREEKPKKPSKNLADELLKFVTVYRTSFQQDSVLCQYDFIRSLGKGTYGEVVLASHKQTEELIAIKVVPKSNTTEQERIWLEYILMGCLEHKNIVNLLGIDEDQENVYLFMEFAEGGELYDFVVSGAEITEPEVRKLFQQLVSALEYAHSNFIVHRDIKLENIFLDKYGNVKLGDFGLAGLWKPGQTQDRSCGSLHYSAPEICDGHKYIGPETDIWSCGVILYVLAAGQLPFNESSVYATYSKIIKGDYKPFPPEMPASLCHLISRMLVVDPVKRATLQEIKAHPWFKEDDDEDELEDEYGDDGESDDEASMDFHPYGGDEDDHGAAMPISRTPTSTATSTLATSVEKANALQTPPSQGGAAADARPVAGDLDKPAVQKPTSLAGAKKGKKGKEADRKGGRVLVKMFSKLRRFTGPAHKAPNVLAANAANMEEEASDTPPTRDEKKEARAKDRREAKEAKGPKDFSPNRATGPVTHLPPVRTTSVMVNLFEEQVAPQMPADELAMHEAKDEEFRCNEEEQQSEIFGNIRPTFVQDRKKVGFNS